MCQLPDIFEERLGSNCGAFTQVCGIIRARGSMGHKNCLYRLVDYENSTLASLKPYPKSYASIKRHFLSICEGVFKETGYQ